MIDKRICPACGSDSWLQKVLCELEEETETNLAFIFRTFMFQCKDLDECGIGFYRFDHPIKFRKKHHQDDR